MAHHGVIELEGLAPEATLAGLPHAAPRTAHLRSTQLGRPAAFHIHVHRTPPHRLGLVSGSRLRLRVSKLRRGCPCCRD